MLEVEKTHRYELGAYEKLGAMQANLGEACGAEMAAQEED